MAALCWWAEACPGRRDGPEEFAITGRISKAICAVAVLAVTTLGAPLCRAQASAIPSAAPPPPPGAETDRGRTLLTEMVAALGGDAWLNRRNWKLVGKSGNFYKGQPSEQVTQLEEYHRVEPYASRVVVISRYGTFIPTDHRDIVELWTPDNGYEITFKGRKPLPPKDVAEYERRQAHTVDVIVQKWLKEPGTQVVYEGTTQVERHLADKVTVLRADDEAATLELDLNTHLPLSRTYRYRDPQFGDFDTDREEYDNYQPEGGSRRR